MTKKCGNCGATALDGESRFCDLCGAPLVEEIDQDYPVCPACGEMIPDDQAQFCDKCGASLAHEPEPMVCPVCGNPALDENSRFCSRCGTTFAPNDPAPGMYQAPPQQPVADLRRSPAIPPVTNVAADESPDGWTPWSDNGPETDIHLIAQNERKRYSRPPLDADASPKPSSQQYQNTIQNSLQGSSRRKKYAHLPLVADELKEQGTHEPEQGGNPEYPPQNDRQNQKKGGIRFLR